MAVTSITDVARRDWLSGNVYNMSTNALWLALYDGSGHSQTTTSYSATSESVGSGYVARGLQLSGLTENLDTTNHVAFLDFNDLTFTTVTVTATDVLIFNETVTTPTNDPAFYVGDLSGSKSAVAGNFEIIMPAATFSSAIIRIA